MTRLDFVRKLYNGRNCYSDHMSDQELSLLRIKSRVEDIIVDLISKGKIVFLTGNPGDGKTFIIKALKSAIAQYNAYVQTDLNNVADYNSIAKDLLHCYQHKRSAIIAVNEYPFLQLLRCIKENSLSLYQEIQTVKKQIIAYGASCPLASPVAIIDLNERNLLGAEYGLLEELLSKTTQLLREDPMHNHTLAENLAALENPDIRKQLLVLFEYAASDCEHFAIRDILGAIAYMLTACTLEDSTDLPYYCALFEGSNELLHVIQQYDPLQLTIPELDERLWNGEIVDGWLRNAPVHFPVEYQDVDKALDCFRRIKRKYFFENVRGKDLVELYPEEVVKSKRVFIEFEAHKKRIKESLILAINKLFLPSSTDKKRLHIWTTHRLDISIEAAVAVSSKAVDSSALDIQMPRPADWLMGLEYAPNHIILKPREAQEPRLVIDIDFYRTLHAVEHGYPVNMLAPHYEQAAALFLQQLSNDGFADDNDDGEIMIASRNQSYKKTVYIVDGKYGFGEEEY